MTPEAYRLRSVLAGHHVPLKIYELVKATGMDADTVEHTLKQHPDVFVRTEDVLRVHLWGLA